MVAAAPEEAVRPPLLIQGWRDLTFLHWPVDPDAIGCRLPPGMRPDVHDGMAWVTLTPFLQQGFRLPLTPALPGVSTFPETNLRTYVVGPDGRDGLWFLSLEVDSLLNVVAAQALLRLPYRWAHMSVERDGADLRYSSRRRLGRPVGHRISVRPGPALLPEEVGPLDLWLTGRWRAWTSVAGLLVSVAVEHAPWPLRRAEVLELEEDLLDDFGLVPVGDALARFSPGVVARFGNPRVRPRPRRR